MFQGIRGKHRHKRPHYPFRLWNIAPVASHDIRTHVNRPFDSRELASQSRVSGVPHLAVSAGGVPNRLKRNPAIECYEPSAIPNGEAEQIRVRDPPRTVDPRCIE